MLRLLGRSKTKKFDKETEDAKPKEPVKRKPVKERSPARPPQVEAPSELQVARADAFKKTHVVQEKGLPSFAEFGTKDMLLYEDDSDEDEPGNDREPTLKAGLMVPGQDDRRGRGRHSAGSGSAYSRSPSPQLMPPSRDPSPMGRVPSPHISPLRERAYTYDQYQHSPQHGTGQNLGSYYSDRPAADPAWRSSSYDPYGPQTTPNSYHQPTSAYPQDYYTSANPGGYDYRTPNSGDPYGLAPQMPPYTAPPQLHDPYRQPVHPPTHWNDVQPQYPSPSTDRYYGSPGHSHQRAQSYDQPAYYGQAGSPARYPPSQPPSVPHQAGTWGAEVYEDPRARQYSQTNAWQNPASGYTPPHHQSFPTRQAPSPQPYAHHHRSHTVDAGIPYYSTTPAPPAPSNPLPTRASEHQLRSQQWDHQALDEQIRRRTYSLQQPDSRAYQEEYDVRAQRTGRHSDYTQHDPRSQPATQPAYGSQQYPQPTSQQVSRSNTRRRVESMTTQLERTHISSPARPASRQGAARLSIYHTPSDSRSRDSFDFSSSSEVDVSPSPSPAPRRHRQRTSSLVDGRPQSVYPPSDPRTSLQSLPEEGYTYNEPERLHGAGGYHQNYERERTKQLPDPVRSTPREVPTFEEPSPGPTLQDIRRKATRRYTEAPREIEDRHRSRSRHSEVSGTQQHQQDYSDRGRELPQPTEPYSREPSTAGYEPENISHYTQVQTNVDHQYSASAAPQQYIHESDRSSPSKPSRESQMYESQARSHTVYDEPEESVPAPPPPSRTPAPTTPHRRRTVVLNGPRGPRSPPTQNILSSNSPAARVSLARA